MSEPGDQNAAATGRDPYVDWLAACDQALAQGQSPVHSGAPSQAEADTLNLLRRDGP
jgi:hypothetical protein